VLIDFKPRILVYYGLLVTRWVERKEKIVMRNLPIYAGAIIVAVLIVFVLFPLRTYLDRWVDTQAVGPTPAPGSIDGCYTVRYGDNPATISELFWGTQGYNQFLLQSHGRWPVTTENMLQPGDRLFIENAAFNLDQLEPLTECPTPTPSGSASTGASR